MQNKCIRFILDLGPRSHIGSKEFKLANMLPVQDRVRQLKLTHVFKIFHNQCPEYMKEKFLRIRDTPLRLCTRSSTNNFFLPRVTKQAIHSFFFSGIKDWNALPSLIKENNNEMTFKSKIKDHIFNELENKESSNFVYYV